MLFANRDERRRRLLTEESGAAVAPTAEEMRGLARGDANAVRYASGALHANRLRTTDLVPQRPWVLAVTFLAGLLVVAGLEAIYYWMPSLAAQTTDGRIEAFDLDGEGSLAVWFSSMTLAAATAVSLLVYSIRRHKSDDYHGRYRIWVWAGLCWLVMSVDECGSLHEAFKEMMSHLTGTRIAGDGSLWWAGAYLLVLGTVGVRLLLDMRECRSSTAALGATALSYAVAVAAQLGWLLPESGARGVMLEEGAEMVGNLFLLLSMSLHLRYVCLDADGKVVARPKKVRKPKVAKAEKAKTSADAESKPAVVRRRTDVPSSPMPAMVTQKAAALVEKSSSSSSPLASAVAARHGGAQLRVDPPQSDFGNRKLSKAERKALRRMQRVDQDDEDE